jgi:UDP-sugar transporter A1/2/3
MHYSRIMHVDNGRYFTSTAVFFSEVSKCVFCVIVVVIAFVKRKSKEGNQWSWKDMYSEMFGGDAWKLSIPAALYTVASCSANAYNPVQLQNNLEYIALSNLDAATYQVTYQGKILTTALFSVLLLHRSLSTQKWVALFVITFGVALVQLPSDFSIVPFSGTFFSQFVERRNLLVNRSLDVEHRMDKAAGLICVFAACMLSGLAGVYFEKVLKRSEKSIYVRNLQLSFFSLFPAFFLGVLWKDGHEIAQKVRPHTQS